MNDYDPQSCWKRVIAEAATRGDEWNGERFVDTLPERVPVESGVYPISGNPLRYATTRAEYIALRRQHPSRFPRRAR